jgi:hypothetical protein
VLEVSRTADSVSMEMVSGTKIDSRARVLVKPGTMTAWHGKS